MGKPRFSPCTMELRPRQSKSEQVAEANEEPSKKNLSQSKKVGSKKRATRLEKKKVQRGKRAQAKGFKRGKGSKVLSECISAMNYDVEKLVKWAMENTGGTVTQLLRINDPKVDFKVTPDALMKANANTRAFFQRQKLGLNPGELSPANANEESFQATLKALSEIVNGGDGVNAGDVSEPLRMEAKRRAVIMLAMFYEQRAIHLQAKLRESEVRSAKTLEQARVFERESWLHRRKVALITDRLKTLGWTGLGKSNPDAPQLEDTLAEPKTFNDLKANLDVFQIALAQNTSGADLIIQLKTHLLPQRKRVKKLQLNHQKQTRARKQKVKRLLPNQTMKSSRTRAPVSLRGYQMLALLDF